MARQQTSTDSGHRHDGPHDGPDNTPRLRLKRKAPANGHVDGAWWPHSEDLPVELPDLLSVLSIRLGGVARVTYNLNEWTEAPRKMLVNERFVKLDGYQRQPANTIGVLDNLGNQLLLLVVPSRTDADLAHAITMAAAAPDNTSTVDSLLSTGS
ncbi:hypothetical protein H7J88_19160 [Mycolicibacterium flavescens]|uniref:Uncharacterized protein n=1 Tax=Mycolicibacterium flavescens TaxID=1776 RepID=A0A1E3RLU5_MYCFV|nr:DUF5994 family protein [Mycolicibacterium flavescens]MCV7281752.1 hypothetical protein [Mycolicibacterium flavescens]ODQ90856.1 hypothetical protein BHQ18_09055 [Mycolicibacterium flavescens]